MICGVPDEGPLCVVMLMLSGRATPHLHNGILYVGDEEHYVSYRILRTWKKKKKKFTVLKFTSVTTIKSSHD